jgi:putative transposase
LVATKSVLQPIANEKLSALLPGCLALTYNAIHYAEENGISNRKGMKGFYRSLKGVEFHSCYKVAVITRACAVLKSREKARRRGNRINHPKPLRPMVCIISGFFVTAKGRLFIPLERRNEYVDVLLNHHAGEAIEGRELRSLTITPTSISICYSAEVGPLPVRTVFGVDRNEKNLTFGNRERVVQVDMSKTVRIRQTAREVVGSFRRDDVRIRRRIASKHWKRATNRVNQLLHAATNFAVELAMKEGAALALEDITNIRKMYQRGNGQGPDYRFRMNSWPYARAYDQLNYKSPWNGVTFLPLTRVETYGSSMVHWTCGERLREPNRRDQRHRRMLWCQRCKVWVDRDVNSALNLSIRGLSRFDSSLPRSGRDQQALAGEEGLASEAMKGNGGMKVPILRTDASKLLGRRGPKLNGVERDPKSQQNLEA